MIGPPFLFPGTRGTPRSLRFGGEAICLLPESSKKNRVDAMHCCSILHLGPSSGVCVGVRHGTKHLFIPLRNKKNYLAAQTKLRCQNVLVTDLLTAPFSSPVRIQLCQAHSATDKPQTNIAKLPYFIPARASCFRPIFGEKGKVFLVTDVDTKKSRGPS